MTAVSCRSSSFCVAVGFASSASGFQGIAQIYNGTSWTSPAVVDADGGFEAVSCASTTFCVATDSNGRGLRFNGSSWAAPSTITGFGTLVTSVSCPTTTYCLAVGDNGEAAQYNAGYWAATASFAGHAAPVSCGSATFCVDGKGSRYNASAWSQVDGPYTIATVAVSCPTNSFCAAVDGLGDVALGAR
jgi:hypothetical protein